MGEMKASSKSFWSHQASSGRPFPSHPAQPESTCWVPPRGAPDRRGTGALRPTFPAPPLTPSLLLRTDNVSRVIRPRGHEGSREITGRPARSCSASELPTRVASSHWP